MTVLDTEPLAVVGGLISRRKFAKAIRLLQRELASHPDNPRLKLALADVLILDGRSETAAPLLSDLADAFAAEGFTAKAIAVLKKLQRIDSGSSDVEERLADLVQERARPAASAIPDEYKIVGRVKRALAQAEEGLVQEEPAPPHVPSQREEAAPEAPEPPAVPAAPAPEPVVESPSEPAETADDDVMIIDLDFEPAQPDLVTTPLFEGFSRDELIEVIRALRALHFSAGDIVVSEGAPGDSLFIVTSGLVKAFVRDADGHAVKVREMGEGSFFGEISFLSGRRRTATITAAGPVELLELDRATVRKIAATHPRVQDVLVEFYYARGGDESMRVGSEGRGAPAADG